MSRTIKIILSTFFLLVIAGITIWYFYFKPEPPVISSEDRIELTIMPLPAEMILGKEKLALNNSIGLEVNGVTSERLTNAFKRFRVKLKSLTGIDIADNSDSGIYINTQQEANRYPTTDEDESYEIIIDEKNIHLNAITEIGTLRGLESLLQLLKQENESWYWPEMELTDAPRYPWRGLMIDVSRHWIPKDVILRNIDGMAAMKMNVLHLHLSDHQAFRVESKSFPKLHELGSKGNYYSQNDMREIIEYAADRGVQIIPEFDVPGHSASWLVGYPELASAPGPYSLQTFMPLGDPVFDPTKESVYQFLDAFFDEMAALFPSEYVHIGGDEASRKHWEESERINAYMEENNIIDYDAMQAYFNQRLHTIINSKGKKMIGWDEIYHPDLPKDDIIVQAWRGQKVLWESASDNYKAILSAGYYLDHKLSSAKHYSVDPDIIKGGVTITIDSTNWRSWKCDLSLNDSKFTGNLYLFGEGEHLRGIVQLDENIFSFDQVDLNEDGTIKFNHDTQYGKLKYNLKMDGDDISGKTKISIFSINIDGERSGGSDIHDGLQLPTFEKIKPLTDKQRARILGGEACMWSEFVSDKTIDSRIWPRAAVVAEKLWSPKSLTADIDNMYRRLIVIDQYLENLGLLHNKSGDILIKDMVSQSYSQPFSELVELLQEDKLFNRMQIYTDGFTTETPLNRVVDAASPESYTAYQFNKDVDQFIEDGNTEIKERILKQLSIWSQNHTQLASAFLDNDRIREVENHSIHLSRLAAICHNILAENEIMEVQNHEELLNKASVAYGGTLLPVVDGFEKIISSSR